VEGTVAVGEVDIALEVEDIVPGVVGTGLAVVGTAVEVEGKQEQRPLEGTEHRMEVVEPYLN